jgi:hypothetical protein
MSIMSTCWITRGAPPQLGALIERMVEVLLDLIHEKATVRGADGRAAHRGAASCLHSSWEV